MVFIQGTCVRREIYVLPAGFPGMDYAVEIQMSVAFSFTGKT